MTYRVWPSRDDYYLNDAWVVLPQADCLCRSVDALLVVGRIISTGYDGTPFEVKNCSEGSCAYCTSDVLSYQVYQRCLSMHAEQNAIGLAAHHGVMTNYATFYTTVCPCLDCFKLAVQAGSHEIMYDRSLVFSRATGENVSNADNRDKCHCTSTPLS